MTTTATKTKTLDKVLEQIKKLMAFDTDENRSSEEEINTAMKLARKLMAKYDLDEQDVIGHQTEDEMLAGIINQDAYSRKGKLEKEDIELASAVAEVFDVRCLLHRRYVEARLGSNMRHKRNRGGFRQFVTFYGFQRDVAVAVEVYKQLVMTVRVMARMHYGPKWSAQHYSYRSGFAARIDERGREMKKEVMEETNTTAIVLRKTATIDAWIDQNLNLGTARNSKRRNRDWNAYDRGSEDGGRVSLGGSGLDNKGSGNTARKQLS